MERSRSRTERCRVGFGASFVLLVTTIVSVVVAQVAPPFVVARLAGERPTMSALGEGESVTSREIRARDAFTVKRAGRGADRIGPEPSTPCFAALLGAGLVSIAPLDRALLGPSELVTWESPRRHRARLMVFLN